MSIDEQGIRKAAEDELHDCLEVMVLCRPAAILSPSLVSELVVAHKLLLARAAEEIRAVRRCVGLLNDNHDGSLDGNPEHGNRLEAASAWVDRARAAVDADPLLAALLAVAPAAREGE